MSTDTLAAGSLNSFSGLSAGQVQPEEQIFVLTSAQLEALISRAVARAQAPLLQELHALQDRIESLEEEVGCGKGEEPEPHPSLPDGQGSQISLPQVVQDLQARNEALKSELEAFQDFAARQRMEDRQRIAKLEQGETARPPIPGTKTAARIKAFREILKRGSTTFKEIERLLKISPREMLRLTKKLDMRQYEIFRRRGDAREKVIRLRAQIST